MILGLQWNVHVVDIIKIIQLVDSFKNYVKFRVFTFYFDGSIQSKEYFTGRP